MKTFSAALMMTTCILSSGAQGQGSSDPLPPDRPTSTDEDRATWQACAKLTRDREARLDCFDRWATQQRGAELATSQPAELPAGSPARPVVATPPAATPPVTIHITTPPAHDCKSSQYSEMSRFWELEAGTDCGTFGIRGYHPISLAWVGADGVNAQPSSPAPGHTAPVALGYRPSELRIHLSVRTKIAQGLLTQQQPLRRDSLWLGYSQQSNWQFFSGALSRPFRTTDHEPEVTYVYPSDFQLPLGWRLRYSGISLLHQSNGQPLPLSRSWNRTVLMAGMEQGDRFRMQGQVWKRIDEDADDDDNPDISDYIGRAELGAFWNVGADHTLGLTLRHSLRSEARGSVRLDWLRNLSRGSTAGIQKGLRMHTQLFNGYGNSLVDYNQRRTVFSIGLSLVDW